jgi:hypothetical protein
MLDIVTVEVGEKLLEPLVHDLVVRPSVIELREKNSSSLAGLIPKSWKDVRSQVPFYSIPMPLIKLT